MGLRKRQNRSAVTPLDDYACFAQINGSHSFKSAVPNGYVDYEVRKRHGGKVAFFNFELAKEMGLIPANHSHTLNAALSRTLLDTFALVVINEWDIENGRKFPKEDVKPNRYMATRYLQLQHPSKRGTTSGDGRGIWNGEFKARGTTWDVSSSGTGATCLSPAVAIEKKFFRSGDPKVCYGNGYNCVSDGFSTGLMSEIFHKNGIPTERTLVIIEYPGGSSINVRAAKNLLRPSHLFHHLKQGNFKALQSAVDYFIQRQVANGEWDCSLRSINVYKYFAEQMALTFSKLAAQFESEYIFCWLDWDGDNILANGGIIDYGSVRQFGLFHSEYRYDDVDRYSTKLAEQKNKARYLVQTCAQIRYFLETGQRKNIRKFRKDPVLKLFDNNFDYWMDETLLKKTGFSNVQRTFLMNNHRSKVNTFRKNYTYFERAQCQRGIHNVADGITSDAVFSMRDCLRELPKKYLSQSQAQTQTPGRHWIEPQDFQPLFKSGYATRKDLKLTPYRVERIRDFQSSYLDLIDTIVQAPDFPRQKRADQVLLELTMRSSIINRPDRITGDGVMDITEILLKMKKKWSQTELQVFFEALVFNQLFDPSQKQPATRSTKNHIREAIKKVQQSLLDYRETV